MPDFGNPFSGNNFERALNKNELIRAIRFSIAAEYEAVQLYTQLADSIDDENSKKVLNDIAEEEIVHAGEFIRLLTHLSPKEAELYLEGRKEVDEMMKKAGYSIKNEILYWKAPSGKEISIQTLKSLREKAILSKVLKKFSRLIDEEDL